MSSELTKIGVYYHPADFLAHPIYKRTWVEGFMHSFKLMLVQEGVGSVQLLDIPFGSVADDCHLVLVVVSDKLVEEHRPSSGSEAVSLPFDCPVFGVYPSDTSFGSSTEGVQDLPRYEFFSFDADTELYEYFEYIGGASDDRYWLALDELVNDAKKALAMPYSSKGPSLSVYLGAAPASLGQLRIQLLRALKNWGCEVYPKAEWGGSIASERLSEVLSKCSLSIHFIGDSYGEMVNAEGQSLMALEYELAIQQKGLGQWVWLPKAQEVFDVQQEIYLDYIRNHHPNKEDYTRVETSYSPFQALLSDDIQKRMHALMSSVKTQEQKPCILGVRSSIGVDWHPLRRFAKEKGWDFEAFDQQVEWEAVQLLLAKVKAIILVEEGGTEPWMQYWIKLMQKAEGYRKPGNSLQRFWVGQQKSLPLGIQVCASIDDVANELSKAELLQK